MLLNQRRFLGITVLGDFILSEGVRGVLRNVQETGATAVACNPTVTAPAGEGEGSFQPPLDAGSSPRVFDRPLFGKTSLWVRSGPSYRPNAEFYAGSPYGPRQPNELTERHGEVIGRFIEAAVRDGLKVYLQLGAAQPSGLRDEDRPRLPTGEIPARRMADTASLAAEPVRAYNRAYVRDLLEAYPRITGFRPDWPEYPCYTLGEAFQDFGAHAERWAKRQGFEIDAIRAEVGALWDYLHGSLSSADLRDFASPERGTFSLLSLLGRFPAAAEWLRLKAALSADMLRCWRESIDEYGGEKELAANAFMPPYSLVTGFDFARAAEHCDSIAPKLYTMHWSLMLSFWGEELLQANHGLDESVVVTALANLMDLTDGGSSGSQQTEAPGATGSERSPSAQPRPLNRLTDYGYPKPDQPHPIPDAPQLRKIAQARQAADGVPASARRRGHTGEFRQSAAVYPLVHGYGPPDDFRRRLQLVADSGADGVWINRYGYLSDEKLSIIAEVWS